jgi:hypothetical protein
MTNTAIIIGGGSSIKENLSNLQEELKDRFTVGLNWSFNHFNDCTFYSYVDNASFYQKAGKDTLNKLPLIICKDWGINHLNNTIPLKASSNYYRDLYPPKPYPQERGVYCAKLCGLFALTLVIYLLQEGTIYLLGYDGGAINNEKDSKNRHITHYYQGEIKHNGIGRISWYTHKDRLIREFAPYQNEKKIRIINVSINSRIDIFPKINYEKFYKEISKLPKINQEVLRNEIKHKLNSE